MLKIFSKENKRYDYEEVLSQLSKLRDDLEKLKGEFKEIRLKYETWLEEKEYTIRELRDKIAKKVAYLINKEDNLNFRDIAKAKLLRRYGYMPKEKSLNNQTTLDMYEKKG